MVCMQLLPRAIPSATPEPFQVQEQKCKSGRLGMPGPEVVAAARDAGGNFGRALHLSASSLFCVPSDAHRSTHALCLHYFLCCCCCCCCCFQWGMMKKQAFEYPARRAGEQKVHCDHRVHACSCIPSNSPELHQYGPSDRPGNHLCKDQPIGLQNGPTGMCAYTRGTSGKGVRTGKYRNTKGYKAGGVRPNKVS